MAKKKTTKFKVYPQTYQFGGMPFLDQYQKLGKQWDTFWRGGDYFSPGNQPPTGVYADPNAMLYNTVSNNNVTAANYKANQQTLKDNSYAGDWGPEAHNYYYNKSLNGIYSESQLQGFSNLHKQNFNRDPQAAQDFATANGITIKDYQDWGRGRDAYAVQAGAQFDSERSKRNTALAEQPGVNKQMGDAFANSAAGIFSGLNYINSYIPPEKINLQKGFQGVQYAQYGNKVGQPISNYSVTSENPNKTISSFNGPLANNINFEGRGAPLDSEYNLVMTNNDILESVIGIQGLGKNALKKLSKNKLIDLLKVNSKNIISSTAQQGLQESVSSWEHGGNINLTGYTPGTPTMNNSINEIPSGNISAEQTPIPILAIGKKGSDNGLVKILQPNSKGYNFKSKSTVEIPLEQQTQQQMTPMARYGRPLPYAQSGLNIAAMLSGAAGQIPNLQNQQANYLNTISGGDYINATPEFNQRMLAGFNQQQVPQAVPQTGMMRPNNGLFPQQAAYTQPLPGDTSSSKKPIKSEVYSIKGDRTYEYSKDSNGEWLTRKKGSKGAWIYIGDNQDAVTKLNTQAQAGEINVAKTASGAPRKSTASSIIKAAGNTLTGSSRAGVFPENLSTANSQGMQWGYDPNDTGSNMSSNFQFPFLNNLNPGTPIGNQNVPMSTSNSAPYNSNYNLQVTDENPTNNSNFAAPIDYFKQKGLPYTQVPDAIALQNANSMNMSAIPVGGLVTKIPGVGKVVQYGANKFVNSAGKIYNKAGKYLGDLKHTDEISKILKQGPNIPKNYGTNISPNIKELTKIRANNSEILAPFKAGNLLKDNTVASIAKSMVGKTKNQILQAKKQMSPARFKEVIDELRKIDPTIRYQYGGSVPHFQFGGSVNDEHATPIFSSNLEDFGLTELQTEKGELAFMPDGSIVDVKAKESHKKQDKDNVSDIMQSGTYVFSNDPKMKFGIKSKIGGVALGDMKLGKSVFKYKENEISPGPEDIMLKDMFFNGSKKELTTADIAKNVKKNLPIVDLKNDYFADRSIAENKDQRKEYLSVLKAFNEYRKPKSRSIPKAQYGMPIQPTQNGLDGVMGYGDKQMDPFKQMDNNMISMWNIPQPKIPALPKIYGDGGAVEQAQLGKLLRYTVPGAYFASEWIGNNKKKKQERENARLSAEAQGYRDQLQQGVDRSGALGVGTNIASYAAALNVPLQRYDDQSEQMSLYNAAANRAAQRLEASKYTASQGIGGASSLARYSNPTNYGDFLAKTQAQSDSSIGRINQAIADLDMQRANANVGFISARNAGRNQSLNSRDTQVYNANVQGIGNVGRSAQEATFNSADTRYRMGNEKMAYDAYLKDKAQAAKDKVTQDWEGSLDTLGQIGLTAATGGFGNLGGGGNKGGQAGGGFNPGVFNWQNPNQQFQQSPNNGLFQNTYPNFPTYSTLIPGGITDRSGTMFNIPIFR